MNLSKYRGGLAAASIALLVAFTAPVTPASAQATRDKVLSIITEASKAAGAKEVKWGSVSGDDAEFTVDSSETTFETDGKTSTLTAGKVVYRGAKPSADGGFTADLVTASDVEFESDDASMSIDSLTITNYVGQSPEKIRAKTTSGERFDRIEATGIEITDENDKSVPIASVVVAASDYVAGIPRKSTVDVKGIKVPVDAADEQMKDVAELGYKELVLDAGLAATWDDKTGRVSVDRLSVSGAEAGSLALSFALGGVTPEVIEAFKKAEKDQAKQMELLQALTVEKLTLRYDDASLAKRVLSNQAKKQGIPADALVQQLSAMVPMVASSIGNKDFEKKIATATAAFLKAPKSLTVSAAPAKPLPVAELMGAAMMAPQSLPTVLGADVRAND